MSFAFPKDYDVDETPANAFPKASFDGLSFPYSELTVKGGIRFAKHEYPHSPGADIEKMGRHPYEVTFHAWFHEVPGSAIDRQYPDLYASLAELREKFEKEVTANLVVPTIGTMKACATSWTQRFDPRVPSGESFEIAFVEDQDNATLVQSVIVPGVAVISSANDALLAAAALADFNKATTQSLFQDINDAVTAVQGAIDLGDAYSRLVEGKIRALENLCATADRDLDELQDPTNHLVLDALKDLWASAQQLADNVVSTQQTILTYRVPRPMSVNQIAIAIYGTSERGFDILQLNDFDDSSKVPVGALVRYVASQTHVLGQAV